MQREERAMARAAVPVSACGARGYADHGRRRFRDDDIPARLRRSVLPFLTCGRFAATTLLAPLAPRAAQELDERAQRGRRLSPLRIVEEAAREGRTIRREHADES